MDRRKFIQTGIALGTTVGVPTLALTQTASAKWPSKPIQLVVAFAPGGATDITARLISAKLTEIIGQRFVVLNRPGGGSNIGAEFAAKSPADGYTLFLGTVSNVINMTLYKDIRYNILEDFIPISSISSGPALLVASSKSPVQTVQELIKLAKERPGKMNYASSGVGTIPHLAGELLISRFGLDATHIAYKGAAAALTDTISGVTDFGFTSPLSSIPSIQAGRLTPLAVSSSKRLALLPNVPTMAEAGIDDFEFTFWNGLFAPAGTPKDIVDRLSAACASIANMEDVQEIFAAQASVLSSSTPEEYKEFLSSEVKMWGDVVRLTGASAN